MHNSEYGGALLADDMGLGKTIQVCAYLQCIHNIDKLDSCLIVVPASMLDVWVKTFSSWTSTEYFSLSDVDLPTICFHNLSQAERLSIRSQIRNDLLIVITTYGSVKQHLEYFSGMWKDKESSDRWDYIILDEGHKVSLL